MNTKLINEGLNVERVWTGPIYLMDLESLKSASSGNLGAVDTDTLAGFEEGAEKIAREKGIKKYKIVVAVKFSKATASGISETVARLSGIDLGAFIPFARMMCVSMPEVHVIDADKYTVPD